MTAWAVTALSNGRDGYMVLTPGASDSRRVATNKPRSQKYEAQDEEGRA